MMYGTVDAIATLEYGIWRHFANYLYFAVTG